MGVRSEELGIRSWGSAAAVWEGVFGVGAGQNGRGGVRQTRASNARPYYIIGKSEGILREACLSLVGVCMAGPPTVRGRIFGVAGVARAGVFGVGCRAKRRGQRSANPGEQCSPLLYNRKSLGCFCVGLAMQRSPNS